jgi:hypothetical protein
LVGYQGDSYQNDDKRKRVSPHLSSPFLAVRHCPLGVIPAGCILSTFFQLRILKDIFRNSIRIK